MFLGSPGILNFAYTDPIQRDVGVLQRNTIGGVDHLPCLRWVGPAILCTGCRWMENQIVNRTCNGCHQKQSEWSLTVAMHEVVDESSIQKRRTGLDKGRKRVRIGPKGRKRMQSISRPHRRNKLASNPRCGYRFGGYERPNGDPHRAILLHILGMERDVLTFSEVSGRISKEYSFQWNCGPPDRQRPTKSLLEWKVYPFTRFSHRARITAHSRRRRGIGRRFGCD